MKKKLLFLLSLCIVTSVAFASATYAWFADQYNPEVSDLSFTIDTQDHILISKDGGIPGTFKDTLKFSDLVDEKKASLSPLEGHVGENSISILDNGSVATSNFIKFTLYFTASKDTDLYLAGSDQGILLYVEEAVENILGQAQINNIQNCLRIGFLAYQRIETPDSGGNIQVSHVPSYTNIYSLRQRENSDYKGNVKPYDTYSTLGYKEGLSGDVAILDIDALKVSKMDIFIWLESQDKASEEAIIGLKLKVYLRFEGLMVKEGDDE